MLHFFEPFHLIFAAATPSAATRLLLGATGSSSTSSTSGLGRRPSHTLRVLVADDNPVNQIVIRKVLEHMDIEPELCENGLQAFNAVERQSYDLILMDCRMPELDGYGATARIRDLEKSRGEKDSHRTVIVGVTAYAIEGDRERCLAAGMDDYLTKPVTVSDLEKIIARWLGPETVK